MNTKAFILLLIAVLGIGVFIGGAFAGGIALGKTQGQKEAQARSTAQPSSQLGQQQEQMRQQILSGTLGPEQLQQFRQRFQGTVTPGEQSQGFIGAGGLAGTIEKIEGSTLTINTTQGPLQVTIGADTVVQKFLQGTPADLQTGVQVTVTGQRGEDGTVQARSIMITPEGTTGGFPFGPGFRGTPQPEQPSQ